MLLQQRPPGHRRRPGHRRAAPQFAIERLREVGRIAVVNRAVPAHHIGNLRRQLAGKRGGNLRTDVVRRPRPVPLHIRLHPPIAHVAPANAIHCAARPADLSRAARRKHHQRRRRGPERLHDLPRVDQIRPTLGRLKQQHRPQALVDIAMTRQMHRLERTLLRYQSPPEKLQRASLLDNHVHPPVAARRRQNGRFLPLEIQVHLPLRGGRHEHQLQVVVTRLKPYRGAMVAKQSIDRRAAAVAVDRSADAGDDGEVVGRHCEERSHAATAAFVVAVGFFNEPEPFAIELPCPSKTRLAL